MHQQLIISILLFSWWLHFRGGIHTFFRAPFAICEIVNLLVWKFICLIERIYRRDNALIYTNWLTRGTCWNPFFFLRVKNFFFFSVNTQDSNFVHLSNKYNHICVKILVRIFLEFKVILMPKQRCYY